MPLASYQGKLFVKTVTEIVDGEEVEVQKLCTSCCDGYDPYGCCCYLASDGTWQKEQLTATDCAGMPESSFSAETDCDDVECPPVDPPLTPGVCLYRDNEAGYCEYWDSTGSGDSYTTEEEAQLALDSLESWPKLKNPETGEEMVSAVGYIYSDAPDSWYMVYTNLEEDGDENGGFGTAYRVASEGTTLEDCPRVDDYDFCSGLQNCSPSNAGEATLEMLDYKFTYTGELLCKGVDDISDCSGPDARFCPNLTCADIDLSNPPADCISPTRSNPLP